MSAGEPHIIRLRGPWEFTLLDGPRAGEGGRLDLGGNWQSALAPEANAIRLTRFFQAPTGLEPTTLVLLQLRGFPADVRVSLDGQGITALTAGGYDLTEHLDRRHRLDVDIASRQSLKSPGEVWLEIFQ